MSEPTDEIPRLPPPSTLAIATGFLLIYLSWGTTYSVTGFAMQNAKMPPAIFGGARLLLAGAILILYQAARGESLRITKNEFLRLLPVSVTLFLMGNLAITIGQKAVNSGVAAILIATTPLFIGFIGTRWPGGEKLSRRGWLGLIIGFAGIILTMTPLIKKEEISLATTFPFLLVLASAASWALGSILSRTLVVKLPHLTSAGYQMLIGGLGQTAIGSASGEWPVLIEHASEKALAAFIYLLLVGSLIGFVTFNWLLVHIPAAQVGTYAYVNPVIAVFIGCILGEPFHWSLVAGIAVILVGVYLVRGDHRPTEEIELEPD